MLLLSVYVCLTTVLLHTLNSPGGNGKEMCSARKRERETPRAHEKQKGKLFIFGFYIRKNQEEWAAAVV